jgi:hypothetical protein
MSMYALLFTMFIRICQISQYIVLSMCMYFDIHAHKVKFDRTEQKEQYLTSQTQMNSNEQYYINSDNSYMRYVRYLFFILH